MNWDEIIIPECLVDTTLVETLVYPKNGYNHTYGCNNVLKKMSEKFANKVAFGIIDDDDVVPKAFNSFVLLKKHSANLSIYKHKEKPHYIVKLSKAAEDFILKNAEKCNISLSEYNLPGDLEGLKKKTKHLSTKKDPDLKKLFSKIKENDNSDFHTLAQWIEEFKSNPYNLQFLL
jgi:hypothetical protein